MSNTAKIDGMAYETAGNKTVSKNTGKKVALKVANQLSTSSLVWLLVRRHKVGLLMVGNIILVMNWALPEWPQMMLGLVGK